MSNLTDFMENAFVDGVFRSKSAAAWAASTAYSVGDLVYASAGDGNIYECVTAGTSGTTEPTWNTSLGATTTDGGVTWKALKPAGRFLKRPLYVALFTAAPSDAGGGTEVSGGGYARVQHDPADANWDATSGTDGHTQNSAAITFPTATANWGTVTHFAIFDAATGGNMLVWGALTTSQAVNSGNTAKFNTGDLDITVD